MVDPCIPASWEEFSVTRKFRGCMYRIKVTNPRHVKKGVASLVVNGAPVEGLVVPLFGNGGVVSVEVTMG